MGWFFYDKDLRRDRDKIMRKKIVVSNFIASNAYRGAILVTRNEKVFGNSFMLGKLQHINVSFLWPKQAIILSFLHEGRLIRILNVTC